jgi:hypothetical protein
LYFIKASDSNEVEITDKRYFPRELRKPEEGGKVPEPGLGCNNLIPW